MSDIFLIIALVLNLLVFLLYAFDKARAVRNGKYKNGREKRRIPENTLLLWSIFGIIGAILAIFLLNHKKRKKKFRIWIPVITILEAAILVLILYVLKK